MKTSSCDKQMSFHKTAKLNELLSCLALIRPNILNLLNPFFFGKFTPIPGPALAWNTKSINN